MAEWDYEVFWKETMSQLSANLGEEEFSIWFNNLKYLQAGEKRITVTVPSSFYRDQVKNRYQKTIENKLRELSGKELLIDFEVIPEKIPKNDPVRTEPSSKNTESGGKTGSNSVSGSIPEAVQPKKEKKPRPGYLREDYTFDKYVIGENNGFAANAAIAISKNPGKAYNPFLIYGGVGLGKTHLMQAIGNHIYEVSDNKIISITAENFLNEYVQAIQENRMNSFKNKFRYTDILLIDDIQFFQGKEGVQEELFHTFNALLDAKKQLVFTCDRPVSELKKFSERLISRFEQSLKVDLQPPRYETRCAILKSIAEGRGASIPDEVIDLISKNISSNVRDLISALNTLISYMELMGKPITLEIAQQRLRDVFVSPRQANLSVDNIQKVVADYFSLNANDLKGKKKTQNIVFPRQIAMYIAREITDYSTTELGQSFGGRDHTTVMHSIEKIKGQLLTDPSLESTIESLKRLIKEYSAKS
ncbi:MAG: chromosomal replication initiator protein DnaA [Treponema sp.]|jgi:chromosomal replication initiator protein|nr:chromosomal replication initiator protein DnaA [Treponema sp.]